MEKKRKKSLNQVKQFCDFIMDETGTVKFEMTGEECFEMINCLISLQLTAEEILKDELSKKMKN